MKTKRSFCSSTIEGTKTKRSIRSSTIDDLLLLVLCLILRTEFRKLALLFVPWNGISSCFLFREMVWNRIPSVFFYFCSTARNSELFSLLWNGSDRNSDSFLFSGTARIPPEPSNCSVNSVKCKQPFRKQSAALQKEGDQWVLAGRARPWATLLPSE
jgi:hypothetical protein